MVKISLFSNLHKDAVQYIGDFLHLDEISNL